jgi:arabinofuranosyltransferase
MKKRWLPISFLLGAQAAAMAALAWRFRDFALDDFFITYRYALHLAAGDGLRFNPDEIVFGTTAPGFALLLGVLARITGAALPHLGTALTVAALAVVCGLCVRDGAAGGRLPEAAGAGLLISISTFLWIHNGSEVFAVASLLMLAGHLGWPAGDPANDRYAGRREAAAGALAGLAVWCRPDAVLGVAALGLLLWLHRRRLPLRFGLSAAAVVLAGLGAARLWFGHFLPQTLAAKRLQAAWQPAAWPSGTEFWPAFASYLGDLALGDAVVPLVVLGAAGCAVAYRRGGGALRTLLAWAGVTVAAYPLLGVAMYSWYGIPIVLALLIGYAFATGWVCRRCWSYLGPSVAGGTAALVLGAALLWPLASVTARLAWGVVEAGIQPVRLEDYRRAGAWLAANTPPGARVAALEVGTIGFYSGRHVHDLLGLVSPVSLPHVAAGSLQGAFTAGRPDVFVYYSPQAAMLDRILDMDGFAEHWEPAVRFERPRSEAALIVYMRRPAPLPVPGGVVGPAPGAAPSPAGGSG